MSLRLDPSDCLPPQAAAPADAPFGAQTCFLRGTRIATVRGEVEVEALRVGDLAVTASGLRPVTRIERRGLNGGDPVRILARAFGETPRRDLWLGPGHGVAAEGALIPIAALANGVTLRREASGGAEAYGLELDGPDIVFAEGLPVEAGAARANRALAPGRGAVVEGLKTRLIEAVLAQGHGLTDDADPCLMADGARIEPVRLSQGRLAFITPAPRDDLVLTSRVFTPAHVLPASADDRALGLCVTRLQIDGDEIALDSTELDEGWHAPEGAAGAPERRWTRGAARLRPGARCVIVDLAPGGPYWRAPDAPLDPVVALFG
ncbi:hypothetical protein M2322_002295 [Rhodoblastus acidophilus]|uniref:Hint domain-containing protein n=1 Tax=Rhodoblastus acidophilus TaxID=1074 RepID=UPI00222439DF|nr:Hint domain-containing protein [Rhodoblastus acidophilus]MCW2316747.1 hypothetical protein [Rhodoblastus acidophilus]